MTSEEDEKKRLERIWDMLKGKNGDSQSRGVPRRRQKGNGSFPDEYKQDPKRDRGK